MNFSTVKSARPSCVITILTHVTNSFYLPARTSTYKVTIFVIFYSGASYIGVTTTTMNPAYTPKEIAHQMKMSGATWAVVHHDLVPVMKASVDILEREGVFKRGDWRDRIFVIGGG